MSVLTSIFGFIKSQTTDNIGQFVGTDLPANWDKVETELNARPTTTAMNTALGDKQDAMTEGTDYCGIDTNNTGKINPVRASAPVIEVTVDTTLALSHAGALVQVNSASNLTITIPTNDTVAFAVGTEIEVVRYNTGTVTIAGATIVSSALGRAISSQYASVCLKKMATDTWLLQGALG